MRCSVCNARFPFEKSVPNHICLDGKLNGCSCTAPPSPDTGHGADEARVKRGMKAFPCGDVPDEWNIRDVVEAVLAAADGEGSDGGD
jgi:hypothetical protein